MPGTSYSGTNTKSDFSGHVIITTIIMNDVTHYILIFSRSVYATIPGHVIVNILSCFSGLVVFSYYTDLGCDPLKAGYIPSPNHVSTLSTVRCSKSLDKWSLHNFLEVKFLLLL